MSLATAAARLRRRSGLLDRRAPLLALLPLLAAACDGSGLYAPSNAPPPATSLERLRPARPEVSSLSLSPSADGGVDVILRFTQAMNRNSVESALAVVAARQTIFSAADGEVMPPTASFSWRSDDREVLFQVGAASEPLVVTIAPGAVGQNELELDGTAALRPGSEIGTYHRFEDDGFSGPATYVSLPFYPVDSNELETHPQFLLSDQRPRLTCFDLQAAIPATVGDLGTLEAGAKVICALDDRSFVPDRTGVVERRAPRMWDPAALPTAVFLQGEREVTGTVTLGPAGELPVRASDRVLTILADTRLTLAETALPEATLTHVYLVPGLDDAPVFPVTGSTPPGQLWLAPILHAGTGLQDTAEPLLIFDVGGQAWLRDEFVGQVFRRLSDNASATIVENRASDFLLGANLACGDCAYQIRTRVGGRFSPGATVRLTSDRIGIAPADELTSGIWTLRVRGGRDLPGLPLTDGVRDGDEVNGVPEDDVEFTLIVP